MINPIPDYYPFRFLSRKECIHFHKPHALSFLFGHDLDCGSDPSIVRDDSVVKCLFHDSWPSPFRFQKTWWSRCSRQSRTECCSFKIKFDQNGFFLCESCTTFIIKFDNFMTVIFNKFSRFRKNYSIHYFCHSIKILCNGLVINAS